MLKPLSLSNHLTHFLPLMSLFKADLLENMVTVCSKSAHVKFPKIVLMAESGTAATKWSGAFADSEAATIHLEHFNDDVVHHALDVMTLAYLAKQTQAGDLCSSRYVAAEEVMEQQLDRNFVAEDCGG